MDSGYIKLDRNILNWEWYSDKPTKCLFIHLLLKANWQNAEWRGIKIKRGQLFTSTQHLAENLDLTTKAIRLSLIKLKRTNEIAYEGQANGTLITIVKYDVYQQNEITKGEQKGKQKDKSRANEGQTKGNKEEEKEIKEIIYYRKFKHLSISIEENQKLFNLGYSQEQINDIYNRIENFKKNTNYVSLYFTSLTWLKKEYPNTEKTETGTYTDVQLREVRAQQASGFGYPEWFKKEHEHLL